MICFLRNENTGRRFCTGGGELFIAGDDGGLDRGVSSDHTAGEFFGLDVGGSEASLGIIESFKVVPDVCIFVVSTSVASKAHSTRLRLVGGSSSYRERFCRA